ncbi:DNA translocase FtsK, partial [Vibrio parahaemolyticus]|nr:DNA translocase FtsK [Vibrio parahaemolyticus]
SVEPDYAEYEQFEAEQVQQPSIEHPVHEEPAIDSAVLDSITAQTESSQHIEPTISDFDVLDDEDEVESQPAQQVQPTTPHQQAATPSTTFEPAPQKVEVEEVQDNDQDVTAFQDMVSNAQAKVAATQNPFLVQKEENLPVPEEPLPTLELLYHPEKRENFIDRDALEQVARLVESKLADYK